MALRLYSPERTEYDPVVITGIGMITSLGADRESVWSAVRAGKSGIRRLNADEGYPRNLRVGAVVDLPDLPAGRLKTLHLAEKAAAEALADACVDDGRIDPERFACAVSGHMGDWSSLAASYPNSPDRPAHCDRWWEQWFPNTSCWNIANRYQLLGPRICHSTACASGLIDFLCAVRAIQDGQCDIALAGSAEAIDPLFAAGFQQMRVLADDECPDRACRPFDRTRQGFVMGEGAAMFVIERRSHALARQAPIYAEIRAGRMLSDAHHVTGLDTDSDSLAHLIQAVLRRADLPPDQIGYVNAHGTGTQQNDLLEIRGIRQAMGQAARQLCVSANKSMLGHLVNAAGSVELALTALAMRDRFVPPTLNLRDPDPECDLDCLPLVGRRCQFDHALKLSIAFGGHLVAVVVSRSASIAAEQQVATRRKMAA